MRNARKDLLAEPLFLPSCFPHSIPPSLWPPKKSTRNGRLSCLRYLARTLDLRCATAAAAGNAPLGHQSALIIARLTQACQKEPFLIAPYVAASGASDLANAVWNLCDSRAGNGEDFSRLETALGRIDFRAATALAFSSELIVGSGQYRLYKAAPELFIPFITDFYGHPDPTQLMFYRVFVRLPSGFFDANSAMLSNTEFVYLVKPLRNRGWRAALDSSHELEAMLQKREAKPWSHLSTSMASISVRGAEGSIPRGIYAQTLVNQAIIACALERHRIQNGSYPDSLDLVKLTDGKSLPTDILTGKPMGYRTTANGKYALWCVSLNGKDHGGTRVLDKEHPENTKFRKDTYEGDWVWDFPEK